MSHQEFLDTLEQQVEDQLKEAIAVFQNLPEDRLLQPTANGGWSIAECFLHLNSYADFYLPRITHALANADAINSNEPFKHGFLGKYFIDMMDAERSTKKYKAMKKHRPGNAVPAHEAVSGFIAHLETLQALVRNARGKALNQSVKTSISPLLSIKVGDALQFVLTHNRRHLLQARKNLKSGIIDQ
ncbi:MAG: DinB family protein [Cyclobacteriaceae bacterium]|nr:DinB family protein [Cyclobacteriaceae bacterium]